MKYEIKCIDSHHFVANVHKFIMTFAHFPKWTKLKSNKPVARIATSLVKCLLQCTPGIRKTLFQVQTWPATQNRTLLACMLIWLISIFSVRTKCSMSRYQGSVTAKPEAQKIWGEDREIPKQQNEYWILHWSWNGNKWGGVIEKRIVRCVATWTKNTLHHC